MAQGVKKILNCSKLMKGSTQLRTLSSEFEVNWCVEIGWERRNPTQTGNRKHSVISLSPTQAVVGNIDVRKTQGEV